MNEADRNRLALLLLNDGGGSLSRRSAVSNAFTSAVAPDPTQAEFLRSEKDTRPFYETEHRASVLPLVMSGYNNSVGYGAPVIAGGRMWDVLGDITSGRPTTMDELHHAAEQGAGAALLSSPFVKAPAGALRSGAMRSQPPAPSRSLDPLGYYSKALEEAQNLPSQASHDQILATLRNKGVKPGEIEATGLAEALMGKPSVSRDDVVRHLTENRVGLNEVKYGGDRTNLSASGLSAEARKEFELFQSYGIGTTLDDLRSFISKEVDDYNFNFRPIPRGLRELSAAIRSGQVREVPEVTGVADIAKYKGYSLDPSNPTYRETVLHLPERPIKPSGMAGTSWGDDVQFTDRGSAGDPNFRKGHFPEPNIVGHLMTSVNKHEGKPVYTIDQIQSDWGQKIETDTRNALAQRLFGKRFKELTADERKQVSAAKQEGDKPAGVRDEAKIAELQLRFDEAAKALAREREVELLPTLTSNGAERLTKRLFGDRATWAELSDQQRHEVAKLSAENTAKNAERYRRMESQEAAVDRLEAE
ncbi:MAG: hypothetical protein EBR82_66205, partial [Caulobacteraceae bacterium]|nr:hypothetical protein [Caulobacteraceae bacterium]